jgi:hypothetical protein
MRVDTTFQGDPVQTTATFQTLASGLNYMAFGEATVPAKQLSVGTELRLRAARLLRNNHGIPGASC